MAGLRDFDADGVISLEHADGFRRAADEKIMAGTTRP